MFYGQAQHSIDQKNRIILPAKYRELLGEEFYVVLGFDPCLCIYTEESYKSFEEKIMALPSSNGGDRIKRHVFNNTEKVKPDKQGRFIIPQTFRDFAGLKKDIIVAGVCSKIEIWDYDRYKANELKPEDAPNMQEILSNFGF